VSLFDVSDIHNPIRTAVYKIKNQGGVPQGEDVWPDWNSSAAEWDHHAFSYFDSLHVLAVPVLDWWYWQGNARLELIDVDTAAGTLSGLGQVKHTDEVLRSVRIGTTLYSIGRDGVRVVDAGDPSTLLKFIEFEDPNEPGGGGVVPVGQVLID
jgi:hypothetical protein